MAVATLTSNDASILSALFDPEASLTNESHTTTAMPPGISARELSQAQYLEKEALLSINAETPSPYDIDTTIEKLSSLTSQYPQYASAYNNRAQALRMRFNLTSSPTDLRLIWSDLSSAISLASPAPPTAPTPELHAKVLASSHTHRGHLLYSASRDDKLLATLSSQVDGMSDLDKETLEEMASRDFSLGGKYGNATAREMAVRTNPYAKLCGSIVKEAMRKEVEEYYRIVPQEIQA